MFIQSFLLILSIVILILFNATHASPCSSTGLILLNVILSISNPPHSHHYPCPSSCLTIFIHSPYTPPALCSHPHPQYFHPNLILSPYSPHPLLSVFILILIVIHNLIQISSLFSFCSFKWHHSRTRAYPSKAQKQIYVYFSNPNILSASHSFSK